MDQSTGNRRSRAERVFLFNVLPGCVLSTFLFAFMFFRWAQGELVVLDEVVSPDSSYRVVNVDRVGQALGATLPFRTRVMLIKGDHKVGSRFSEGVLHGLGKIKMKFRWINARKLHITCELRPGEEILSKKSRVFDVDIEYQIEVAAPAEVPEQ